MIRKVYTYPSPVLRAKSVTMLMSDDAHRELIQDLKDTMEAHNALGIAAVQIGIKARIMVLATPFGPQELINPELLEQAAGGGRHKVIEGCLSFPGIYEEVWRSEWVKVRTSTLDYGMVEFTLHDYDRFPLAQAFQHEYEHFEGITLADKLPSKRARQIREALIRYPKTGYLPHG